MNYYNYGYFVERYEYMEPNKAEEYQAILCPSCAKHKRHPIWEEDLLPIFNQFGKTPKCEDCQRNIGTRAYKRFKKANTEPQPIPNQKTFKECKTCQKIYLPVAPLGESTKTLLLIYCAVTCATDDGIDKAEAERQRREMIWPCEGCKEWFKHDDLIFRKGDHGYTKFCQKCAEDPKYFWSLPYYDRMRLGLVSDEEIRNDYWRQ